MLWVLRRLELMVSQIPGRRCLDAGLLGPRDVENDTANDLDDRDIRRHQLALRNVRDAMVAGGVINSGLMRTRSRVLNSMISVLATPKPPAKRL